MTKSVVARSVIGIAMGIEGLVLITPCREFNMQFFTGGLLILVCGFISWTLPKGNL